MAKGLITRAYLEDTADAIRVLRGESDTYTPDEFGEKIIDAIPTEEVTGSIVSVTDAAAYPAEGLEFAIEPVQDLHGYDKPWPAGGGKNKVNMADRNVTSQALIGRATLPSGTYVASATVKNNSNISGYMQINTSSSSIARATISDVSGTNRIATNSFTLSEPTEILVVVAGNLTGYSFDVSQVQIELGSTATSYEPYANECPISGWTGVNGKRTGKNLFNPNDMVIGLYKNNDFGINTTATYYRSIRLRLKAGTYVISSSKAVRGVRIIANGKWGVINAAFPYSFTLSTDGDFGISFRNEDESSWSDTTLMQIELGSTATSYEPYTGTSIPITFPVSASTVYGGKVDVVNGVLTVDRAEVDLGTLNWILAGTSRYWSAPMTGGYNYNGDDVAEGKAECYSMGNYNSDVNSGRLNYIFYNNTQVYCSNGSLTVAPSGKLIYKLMQPIEYDITPQQVMMLLGNNNVWCDTGDTTLEYKVDLGRYIAKLQASQATQLSLSRQAVSLDAEPRDETTQNEDEAGDVR